jgi:DDHD domain
MFARSKKKTDQEKQMLYEKRYDFILQESLVESMVKTIGLLSAHTSYHRNCDVAFFVLMKLHGEKVKVDIHAK